MRTRDFDFAQSHAIMDGGSISYTPNCITRES
jgi:hypothetical protein